MRRSQRKSNTCTLMLPLYYFLLFVSQASASSDTIYSSQSITDNGGSLVSANGVFELGFFSPANSKYRYLGIQYNQASANAVVWVANRQNPLVDHSGVLRITHQGVLVLQNGKNTTVWSSNKTRSSHNPALQLLNTGNLVVKDSKSNASDNLLWQSFDYPCDTFLAGMKIGSNLLTGEARFLTSWKSPDDPAPGQFSLRIDTRGFPQLVLRNGTLMYYRLGSWNGLRFTGTPQLPSQQYWKYDFQLSNNEVYYSYEVSSPLLTRLVVNQTGFLERFVRVEKSIGWKSVYYAPLDQCDHYSVCGVYMSCNMVDDSPKCDCLAGFIPKSLNDLSKGCVRKILLDCKSDDFQNYTGMKLPDTSFSRFYTNMSLVECRETCLKNCSCTAYADSDISNESSGCLLWFGELKDMRQYGSSEGQDLYIRMSTSNAVTSSNSRKKKLVGITVSSAALVGMLLVALILYVWNKKRRMDYEGEKEDIELPIFNLATIVKATDNFSSDKKLGQGGFGPVYKGVLGDGQEIAVKRLSKSSGQGLTELKNEVILIAKLQHRNLVKLLGCCLEGDEKMLIYEFMPNKSLDFFIFDQIRGKLIDWHKRFLIISGIARGLLYLHQDSRLRIIHRDLKAGNVLLDKDMNPKISDFGLARMFGGDQIEANTNKVVGTYGYMSPEYAVDGLFSLKSDVFSFGVLILEIVSGKKNRGFFHPDHSHNLLGHAWKLWNEERPLDLVDNVLDYSYSVSEVTRCIHLGLLCVQQRPEERPNMSSVVLMLGSEMSLPNPKQPGFFTERNMPEAESPSGKNESSSINEMTSSILHPR